MCNHNSCLLPLLESLFGSFFTISRWMAPSRLPSFWDCKAHQLHVNDFYANFLTLDCRSGHRLSQWKVDRSELCIICKTNLYTIETAINELSILIYWPTMYYHMKIWLHFGESKMNFQKSDVDLGKSDVDFWKSDVGFWKGVVRWEITLIRKNPQIKINNGFLKLDPTFSY